MTDIMKQITDRTVIRVAELKKIKPLDQIIEEANALNLDTGFPFEQVLRTEEISFICEVKKASPSKGIIAEDFPYLEIAREYQESGAAAISVLTEPYGFLGRDEYLTEISSHVNIPVLRKDFTVDSYQIYEAKILGASAILIICALLDTVTMKEYIGIAESLGLSAVVEAHTEEEIESAVKAGARIIGINNRNLKTFEVDINTSIRLRKFVPNGILFISESGIRTKEDIDKLKANGINIVLIGETLMRSKDKKKQIAILRGERIDED